MTMRHRLYVGTIGEGLWRSLDNGETFARACDGMCVECHVRALAVHPEDPQLLYLGTEQGLYVSRDGASNWTRVESPLNGRQIWSILLVPRKPDLLVVGTCPPQLFHSADGGRSWSEAGVAMQQDCPRIMHNRVTSLVADPADADTLWAGVEIDGIFRSRDAGRTWQPVGTGLSSRDIHALCFAGRSPQRFLAATNNDLNVSEDGGATWTPLKIGQAMPWSYCRTLAQPCGEPEIVLLGNGDAPPGTAGVIGRSTDAGRTWKAAQMPARANSTMWNFAAHAADPNLIYASSVSGEVYRSPDKGQTWTKLPREFGEIRALAWTP
jgi:photosystem II stability/assembly factor-like uncharacterized protein